MLAGQVGFICIPVCVSAGFTGEEDSSKNILTSVKGQDSEKEKLSQTLYRKLQVEYNVSLASF